MADLQLYLANRHYHPDAAFNDSAEYDRARSKAMPYFEDATKEALQAFTNTIVDLQRCYGSPKWERERNAAKARYSAATAKARELFELTIDELIATGEVSEAMGERWDALALPVLQAAE